jgi:hypothetical protein
MQAGTGGFYFSPSLHIDSIENPEWQYPYQVFSLQCEISTKRSEGYEESADRSWLHCGRLRGRDGYFQDKN